MTERWRLVNGVELYDMQADPGQADNVASRHTDVVKQLRLAYEAYWSDVHPGDREFARPVVGTPHQREIVLTGEEMRPIAADGRCAWNQAHVARGMRALGYAEIEIARPGEYRFELRRWPREINAPITGIPTWTKTVDAYLHGKPITGLLYGGTAQALPVGRLKLKVGDQPQEVEVKDSEVAKVFVLSLPAGPVRVETELLDKQGAPLAQAYYVYIRPVAAPSTHD